MTLSKLILHTEYFPLPANLKLEFKALGAYVYTTQHVPIAESGLTTTGYLARDGGAS